MAFNDSWGQTRLWKLLPYVDYVQAMDMSNYPNILSPATPAYMESAWGINRIVLPNSPVPLSSIQPMLLNLPQVMPRPQQGPQDAPGSLQISDSSIQDVSMRSDNRTNREDTATDGDSKVTSLPPDSDESKGGDQGGDGGPGAGGARH